MYNTYFETKYSEFWKKQSKVYGKQENDGLDKIIKMLKNIHAKTAFEVGIGTGWPIASELYDDGTEVSGCDVAESLIRTAKENYPLMNLYAGDIWKVPFGEKKYDLVYCIRSSWYMKDFLNVILKMLDITNSAPCPDYYYSLEDIKNVLRKQNFQFSVYSINQLLGEKEYVENSQKLLFIIRKLK